MARERVPRLSAFSEGLDAAHGLVSYVLCFGYCVKCGLVAGALFLFAASTLFYYTDCSPPPLPNLPRVLPLGTQCGHVSLAAGAGTVADADAETLYASQASLQELHLAIFQGDTAKVFFRSTTPTLTLGAGQLWARNVLRPTVFVANFDVVVVRAI